MYLRSTLILSSFLRDGIRNGIISEFTTSTLCIHHLPLILAIYPAHPILVISKGKGKGKVNPRTGHEGPEGE
jgi:hypothetical protein